MNDADIVAAMTALPDCTRTMLVCADAIEERGGRRDALRAEALRLLAECGKVGDDKGYHPARYTGDPATTIPDVWYDTAILPLFDSDTMEQYRHYCNRMENRLALIATYAFADEATRRQWADATRATTPATVH